MTTRRNLPVVDDDPQIGRFLKRYLERESFEVSVAQNGDEMRNGVQLYISIWSSST